MNLKSIFRREINIIQLNLNSKEKEITDQLLHLQILEHIIY